MPDGRTLHQFQPFTRCYADKYATGKHKYDTVDLHGEGMYGAHGGSALSSIGGTLRLGKLVPGGKIPHVMKMNLDCKKNFYYYNTPRRVQLIHCCKYGHCARA